MHEHTHCHDCGHAHCGHEHHHDHGHDCGCAACAGGLKLTHAEGATAASARFALPGPQGVAEVTLAARIKALAADVSARGGLVGHIKAALKSAGEVTTFSCTGGAVSIARPETQAPCAVELAAIVVALDDAAITELIGKHFPEVDA